MAGASKTIGKLQKTAKSKYADLKEKAKEELKLRADDLEKEIKERLPTEEEIKARFIEEIKTRGTPIACSLKAQDLAEKAYNKFKNLTGMINDKSEGVKGFIMGIIEYAANIEILVTMIETFNDLLGPIIELLDAIREVLLGAKKSIELLDLNPLAVGLIIIMSLIEMGIRICTQIALMIGNALKAVMKFIDWIRKKIAMITGMLGQILDIIIKAVAFIKVIDLMVEAAYLMYLNLCNGHPPEEAEDLASSDTLDDFLNDPNFAEDYYNQTIMNLQSLGKDEIIEHIYSLNFKQIGYTRWKPGSSYISNATGGPSPNPYGG
tara:strand:+ start:1677 stop:2639 length:963 start_codon:yes stop_codon:yes gene_type:complete